MHKCALLRMYTVLNLLDHEQKTAELPEKESRRRT